MTSNDINTLVNAALNVADADARMVEADAAFLTVFLALDAAGRADRWRGLDYGAKRRLVAIQPEGVHASLAFADRFTGRVDGMNEHGLCVGLHFVNYRPVRPGLVCILIVRMVLDQCATTQEAVRLLGLEAAAAIQSA